MNAVCGILQTGIFTDIHTYIDLQQTIWSRSGNAIGMNNDNVLSLLFGVIVDIQKKNRIKYIYIFKV